MTKIYLGIDPGNTGAIALIGETISPIVEVMPLRDDLPDIHAIKAVVDRVRNAAYPDRVELLVVIERAQAFPGQGVASVFNYGMGYGALRAMCEAWRWPYSTVHPRTWKKKILEGFGAQDKAAAIKYCHRRYPQVILKRTPKCKKEHDGMAEALCMADFARRFADVMEVQK